MGDEFRVIIEPNAGLPETILNRIAQSPLCVRVGADSLLLKDPAIANHWNYDIRIFRISIAEILIEITNSSQALYDVVLAGLSGNLYQVFEDGYYEETLTLASAFNAR